MARVQELGREPAVTTTQVLTRRSHLELVPRVIRQALAWCVRPTVVVLCTCPQKRLNILDTTSDAASTAPTKNTGWKRRRGKRRRPASQQARRPATQQERRQRAPRTKALDQPRERNSETDTSARRWRDEQIASLYGTQSRDSPCCWECSLEFLFRLPCCWVCSCISFSRILCGWACSLLIFLFRLCSAARGLWHRRALARCTWPPPETDTAGRCIEAPRPLVIADFQIWSWRWTSEASEAAAPRQQADNRRVSDRNTLLRRGR